MSRIFTELRNLELIKQMAGAPEGNHNARKRPRLLTDALRRELTQKPEEALGVARKLIESALAGESWAQNLLWERSEGRMPQAIVGDDEQDPISLREILIRSVNTRDRPTTEGG